MKNYSTTQFSLKRFRVTLILFSSSKRTLGLTGLGLMLFAQVEFEGAKHELRRLQEEVDILNQQVEELGSLKRIAEKQMEEALEALQTEREAKYALKKELDHKMANFSSVYSLSNLAMNFKLGTPEFEIYCSSNQLI